MKPARAPVLAIGGFEAFGAVGLLADHEAVLALGGQPILVPTTLTVQRPGFFCSESVRAASLAAWLEAVGKVPALKVGAVPSLALLRVITQNARGRWWVIDPVVATSKGERLSRLTPGDFLRLAAPQVVLTPNAIEAGWLLGRAAPRDAVEAEDMALELVEHGFGAVIIKGGHLAREPIDVLAQAGRVHRFVGKRSRSSELRGTGCRFGSALAAGLAQGLTCVQATGAAHRYLARLFFKRRR